ncbi:MAG: hypothetical protein EGR26_06155 [Clostridiales bacterium]|nr:hypothetical protein [Clostridiales bacterium]
MAEYIDREAVINRIKEYASDVYGIDLDDPLQFAGNSKAENFCEGLYEATELVDDITAADVAPVVHGRWNDDEDYMFCSKCGMQWNYCDNDTQDFRYCPNCGAKMDGVE